MTLLADSCARYLALGRYDPDHWPHPGVKIDSDWKRDIRPRELWLDLEMGTMGYRWVVVYQLGHTWFYFQHPEDAVLFALRWS
jgi:hypothetical protein